MSVLYLMCPGNRFISEYIPTQVFSLESLKQPKSSLDAARFEVCHRCCICATTG